MTNLINGRTAKAIKIGLRNMLKSCGEMCGEDTRCLHDICPYNGDACCNESIQAGALALIEHLEAKVPKWISVEERLPEGECLALGWQNEMLIGYVGRSDAGYACESGGEYLPDVTHWMPKPEPPEVSK